MKNIGIVIVNWNSLKYTLSFLKDFRASRKSGDLLIIINNSPEDNTHLYQEKSSVVRIINTNKNLGYSGGLNTGIRYLLKRTECEWILLINNDVIIDSKFIEELRSQNNVNAIYSPVITNVGDDIVQNSGGKVRLLYGGTINLNKGRDFKNTKHLSLDFLSGCCLYLHKSVVDRIGLLDESYESYFEDVDYSYRAYRNGIDLEVLWDLKLPHYHSMSTKNNSGYKDFLIARNAIKFAKSNLNGISKMIFIIQSIIVGFFWVLPRPKNLSYFFNGVIKGLK